MYVEPSQFIIEPKFNHEEMIQFARQKKRKGFLNFLGGTGEILDLELYFLPILEVSTMHQEGLVFKKWKRNKFFYDPHSEIVHKHDVKQSAIPFNPKIIESLNGKLVKHPLEHLYRLTQNAIEQQMIKIPFESKITIDSLVLYPFFVAHYQKKLMAIDGVSGDISEEHTTFFEQKLR